MRDFCKFSPEFWSSSLAEQLKKRGRDALLLATYLQTNRHSNMLGVYYLPIAYMSFDTGIPVERIQELLDELKHLNFCHYDFEHAFIWVVELGFIQTGGALKVHDKRVIQLQKQYEALPMVSFLNDFYEKYNTLYHLKASPDMIHTTVNPFDGASKVLRSKKKNKKKENNKEKKNSLFEFNSNAENEDIDKIFNHWKQTLNHPQATLDLKRQRLIQRALKSGYAVEQLCQAITGCSLTPHNMGENDTGQRYDGLHVIFRDADQIDRFIRNFENPPRKTNTSLFERNQAAVQAWIEQEEQQDASE